MPLEHLFQKYSSLSAQIVKHCYAAGLAHGVRVLNPLVSPLLRRSMFVGAPAPGAPGDAIVAMQRLLAHLPRSLGTVVA